MTKTESLLPEYEVKISTANWWLQVGVITFLVILGMTSNKNYGPIESEIGARKFQAENLDLEISTSLNHGDVMATAMLVTTL